MSNNWGAVHYKGGFSMFNKKIEADLQKELLNIVRGWEMELNEYSDQKEAKKKNTNNDMNSLLLTSNRKYKGRGYRGY